MLDELRKINKRKGEAGVAAAQDVIPPTRSRSPGRRYFEPSEPSDSSEEEIKDEDYPRPHMRLPGLLYQGAEWVGDKAKQGVASAADLTRQGVVSATDLSSRGLRGLYNLLPSRRRAAAVP